MSDRRAQFADPHAICALRSPADQTMATASGAATVTGIEIARVADTETSTSPATADSEVHDTAAGIAGAGGVRTRAPRSAADPAGRPRADLDLQIARIDQLSALLSSLYLPVLHLCPAQRLLFFSEAAEQVFGIGAGDLGKQLTLRPPLTPARKPSGRDAVNSDRAANVSCVAGGTSAAGGTGESSGFSMGAPDVWIASGLSGGDWQCRVVAHVTADGAEGGTTVILVAHSEPAVAPAPASPGSAVSICPAEAVADDLTPRQRQVMDLVLAGHPSKNIAADLKISQRTVENHRAAIMRRTGATSLPALVRMALGAAVGADRSLRQSPRPLSGSLV